MRVQFGRFGLDPIVDNAATAARTDTGLTITGIVYAASLDELQILRSQFNGLAQNIDEPIIPVIVEGASDEYWAVSSVSWTDGEGAYDGLFTASWSIDLASIPARSGVLLESRMLFVAAATAPIAIPWTAIPASAQGWASTKASITASDRVSESGKVRIFSGANLADTTVSWRQSPTDAYVGAATISGGPSGYSVDGLPDPSPSAGYWTTPGTHSYVVPAGVTLVRVVAVGGNGSRSSAGAVGGRGAKVACDLAVTPGETLTAVVGGQGQQGAVPPVGTTLGGGAGGTNGGARGGHVIMGHTGYEAGGSGGGGATDVRQGGTGTANRVVVAGGGGGASTNQPGGNAGSNGAAGSPTPPSGGGAGGTSTMGGAGGGGGGAAGVSGTTSGGGGQGGQLPAGQRAGGGGGGGGYTGGGGGFAQDLTDSAVTYKASGGGGGSSLTTGVNAAVSPSYETTPQVIISPITATGVGDPATGVDYHTIVGRQWDIDPWGWIIDNGIVQIQATYSATEIGFAVATWTGTQWGTTHRFGIYRYSGSAYGSATAVPVSATILRNSPEAVALRITYADASTVRSHTVDLTVRRGASLADLTFSTNAGGIWAILHDPNGTASTIDSGPSGVIANSADTDGNKAVITGLDMHSGDVDLTKFGTRFAALPETVHVGVVLASETATTIAQRAGAVGTETVRAVGS